MQNNSDQYDLGSKLGDLFTLGRSFLEDTFKLNEYYLVYAVEQKDVNGVEKCLAADIDPNKPDGLGRLPIGVAVQKGYTHIVGKLIEAGADPNLLDDNGKLPLVTAVLKKNEDVIDLLLQNGANPYLPQKDKTSAFELAEETNNEGLLNKFSEPEIQARRYEKDKRIHEALKAKYRQTLAQKAQQQAKKQLEEEAATLDLYGYEAGNEIAALQKAIFAKDSDALRLIATRCQQTTLNQVLPDGDSLLLNLIKSNAEKAAAFLVGQGADPFLTNASGVSAFTEAIRQKMDDFIKVSLEQPIITSVLNDKQAMLSPLFLGYQNPVYWLWFLRAGAEPTWGGTMGINPMVKAIQKGAVSILPVWKICEIDLNTPIGSSSLLKEAVIHERKDWMQALLTEDVQPIIDGEPLEKWIKENRPNNSLL